MIERLAGFEASIAQRAGRSRTTTPTIELRGDKCRPDRARRLDVSLPTGKPQVAADGIAFAPRDQVLVTGPSGSGKSTLFRAIAGIWPFGKGKVSVPRGRESR